ncbi:glutaredoxin family protein [Amycolatopsis jejuensis]|uniref:glutaredoxin family protein n=1 Tax=Amycolatopsis jejuensis TaxID=330084 RepID=UPI0007C4EDE0|nr:glutaredoxin domain-containing protein [Amycolatopsis jejuensis]
MSWNDTGATVYWRPGCPYCSRLLGDLDRIGLPVRKVNIWEDPQAAAHMRAVAGGNETVPTVVVGDTAMVNPRAGAVLNAVRAHAPDSLAGLGREDLAARAAGMPGWASRCSPPWAGSLLPWPTRRPPI